MAISVSRIQVENHMEFYFYDDNKKIACGKKYGGKFLLEYKNDKMYFNNYKDAKWYLLNL